MKSQKLVHLLFVVICILAFLIGEINNQRNKLNCSRLPREWNDEKILKYCYYYFRQNIISYPEDKFRLYLYPICDEYNTEDCRTSSNKIVGYIESELGLKVKCSELNYKTSKCVQDDDEEDW